ncbi:PmoA family protein [Flavivirga aquimarina]|uniref:PmoA family protein n=1 Tax=Flavivirga aquimarina TaxID=2027862 RepID=A0ABT8W756_9FLAO|nr:DUF6807 family protein [Flavivirga aquimarina]MDO5968946.1 PmoA family protein [Flavivirga aquimarina]
MRNLNCIFLILCFNTIVLSQSVKLKIQDDGVLFKEGKDSILFYQTANKELNGKYKRSNYIHPLYSLDGKILTEDFPEDHPHHRGIFWAWHQLYIGDKRIGDGWIIKNFEWQVLSVEALKNKGKARSIKAHVVWKSPLWLDENGNKKPLVSEYTTITVFPTKQNYRQIDIEIALIAKEPNTRIGGSEDKKGYGGFSPRIQLVEDIIFTSSTGMVEPQNLPIEAGGWIDISGALGHEGSMAGISILSHHKNPGYPNPWILRSKRSMQNAVYPYPGANAVSLSNVEPTVLRYRILIHNGITASEISSQHIQYRKEG